MVPHCSYFVTGANRGCGFEAVLQLAAHFSSQQQQETKTTIYLLCRSEEKAKTAIEIINKSITSDDTKKISRVCLKFLKFNAYDNAENIRNSIDATLGKEDKNSIIAGILLNAGGFGDGSVNISDEKTNSCQIFPNEKPSDYRIACNVSKLNIISHVVLVKHLLATRKTDSSTRIIAVGSESTIVRPIDHKATNFVAHLEGKIPLREKRMPVYYDYMWNKTILALYWAAFARHHPEIYIATVSPGAVKTELINQGAVPSYLRLVTCLSMMLLGSNSVENGAKRYVDALLGEGLWLDDPPKSGSFLASRKNFVKDFGDVKTLKNGNFYTNKELQDKAWTAVKEFV